jgi:hypothetical protein
MSGHAVSLHRKKVAFLPCSTGTVEEMFLRAIS